MAEKMKPCPNGRGHAWAFVKNVNIVRQTLRTMQVSVRGVYKCSCGERKYGNARFPATQPERDGRGNGR